MRCRNLQPDGITLHACFWWPSNESRSRFVQAVFVPHWLINSCSLASLSAGSLISIFTVSGYQGIPGPAVDCPSVLCTPRQGFLLPRSHSRQLELPLHTPGTTPFRKANRHRGNVWPFAPHGGPSSILGHRCKKKLVQSERENCINVQRILPYHSQQRLVCWVDWDIPIGTPQIHLHQQNV